MIYVSLREAAFGVFAQDVTQSRAHDAEASGAARRTEISEDELAWLLKYGPHKPILSEHPVDPVNLPEAGKSCPIFL